VDFYNSSCGACKYILPRFIKLCKGGCGEECPVEHKKSIHFVKHNVHDEYDDLTVRFLLGGWDGFWDGNFDWEEHVFALIQNLSLQLMQIVPFVRVL
jgi:thiol-disulfide isomerase/thioredoxin